MTASGPDQQLNDLAGAITKSAGIPLNRRSFLKGAGLGSLALASLPTLGSALAGKAFAGDLLGFHLVTLGSRGGVPIGPGVQLLVVAGAGQIHGDSISGGGRFARLRVPDPAAPPFVLVDHGTWRAKQVTGWAPIGEAAGLVAGVLDLLVDLTLQSGDVVEDSAQVVCNLGFVGLETELREGLYTGTNFQPLHPEVGLTAFVQL